LPRWTSTVQIRSPAPFYHYGGIAKWLRQRSAKPLFSGSNPDAASNHKGVKAVALAPFLFRPFVGRLDTFQLFHGYPQEGTVKIEVRRGNLAEVTTEAAVLAHFEGDENLRGAAAVIDEKSGGLISEILSRGDNTGRLNQVSVIYSRGGVPAKRILLIGLGKREVFSLEKLRGAFAKAAQHVKSLKVTELATALDFAGPDFSVEDAAEAVVEGVSLGTYQFTRFKTIDCDSIREVSGMTILDPDERRVKTIRTAARNADIVARAVSFARDLVSAPGNQMTPTDLAKEAMKFAGGKRVKCTVLEADDIRKLGMNAILGVAGGSDEPPKFIIMEYRGAKRSSPFIVLVGKGLTFDSGGISLKPSDKMDLMKSDMAGGAAVIGSLCAAAELALPLNLVALVPATENLPDGKAYKPGDVLTSLSGQTIEIVTTDAEGRLILADALTYARRYKPAAMIDIATLTGACVVALGDLVIGMMGTDDVLKREIQTAAEFTGERVWELPLWEEYGELIKGDTADYKNSGGRAGGAITAGFFLSKFTGGYPWVHLDIAGPAWLAKDMPYIPKGASGIGVRLLTRFLRNRAGM
jgi:leucyl aminopeptidase